MLLQIHLGLTNQTEKTNYDSLIARTRFSGGAAENDSGGEGGENTERVRAAISIYSFGHATDHNFAVRQIGRSGGGGG